MDDRGFTFFMEDSRGERAAFDIGYCHDEIEAAAQAHRMLSEVPRYPAIEVFDGQRSFRVVRQAA